MGIGFLTQQQLTKLPLGATGFPRMRRNGLVYVDKTDLVGSIALIENAPVFLSRPRRFGKSLLLSTFESLFSKGLEDFRGLAIEKTWTEKRTFPVVRLSFAEYDLSDVITFRASMYRALRSQFGRFMPIFDHDRSEYEKAPTDFFRELLEKAGDVELVLLIDEYDAPITHTLNRQAQNQQIIDTLSSFFNILKSYSSKFRFIFITGITRVAHTSLFSVFNNLEDLTIDDRATTLLGMTEEELHRYFDPFVRNAAQVLNMDVDDVYARLKARYDGYQFSFDRKSPSLYNPWSVLNFLTKPNMGFQNYWYLSSSGTPTLLVEYFKNNPASADYSDLKNQKNLVTLDQLTSKSEALSIPTDVLLWQTGYYTIRGISQNDAFLQFPNEEVEESIARLCDDIHNRRLTADTTFRLASLAELIDAANLHAIASLFNAILTEGLSPTTKVFQNETDVRDVIYLALREQGLVKRRENPNLLGFSDMELTTAKTRLVIEFKRSFAGRSESDAIQKGVDQTQARQYGISAFDTRHLVRAVFVISSAEKRITSVCSVPTPSPSSDADTV